jgi:hypothetical protein
MSVKDGKYFEELISWINKCLHNTAEIIPNTHLNDKDTGKPRQIDLLIRFKDGPSNSIGIVEIRDRSRKVGVNYIEEVKSKKDSVNADFAVIISNGGFHKTAEKKAQNYNIRVFSFEKALSTDWSKTLAPNFTITYQELKFEEITLYYLDKVSDQIINPSKEFLDKFILEGVTSKIFLNKNMIPYKSLADLIQFIFSRDEVNSAVPIGSAEANNLSFNIYLDFVDEEKIYFFSDKEEMTEVNHIFLVGCFWYEVTYPKFDVSHLKTTDETLAEVINFHAGTNAVDILFENPNDLNSDRKISIRNRTK